MGWWRHEALRSYKVLHIGTAPQSAREDPISPLKILSPKSSLREKRRIPREGR